MLSSASFAPRVALQNFMRNKGLSLFAVSMMTVVLMLTGIGLVMYHSFSQVVSSFSGRASTIELYLGDDTPYSSAQNLADELRADPRISSVTYVSKDAALTRYKNDPEIDPAMVAPLEPGYNPLPASLEVSVRDVKAVDGVVAGIKDSPLLDKQGSSTYRKDVIDKVILFQNLVTIGGSIFLVALAAVAVFIIMMSIRTAVFVRRQEIEVMKLVGATDWFVRGPFLLEGMFAGAIAAIITVVIVGGGYHPLVDHLHGWVPFLPLFYDGGFVGELILTIVLAGIGLGAIGSYLGVRRFLQA